MAVLIALIELVTPELSAQESSADDSRAVSKAGSAESQKSSPLPSGYQVRRADPNYTEEELQELADLEDKAARFAEEVQEFRAVTRRLIERKYNERRASLSDSYERRIVQLEEDQKLRREAAIAKFQGFIDRHPDHPNHTPDAMFRLSELLFERSYDNYLTLRADYDEAIESWDPSSGSAEPAEPVVAYGPTIAMVQRIISEFPRYRLIDGGYYLLGYCLAEQGDEAAAIQVFEDLVARYPNSELRAEVWTRIGEHYFDGDDLRRALAAYQNVLDDEQSVFYDKAMYKLAWTHYRLANPDTAPEEFKAAVDTFVRLLDFNEATKGTDQERGGELRSESIEYIAIAFADEDWGGSDKALDYFRSIGGRPYEREVYVALGDVYLDQTRFPAAIEVYRLVQQRYPMDPEAPKVQEKIIAAYESERDFENAALARAEFAQAFAQGSGWYDANQDNLEALSGSQGLLEKTLYSAALFHHQQAQVLRDAGKYELATEEYGKAAESYDAYLKRYPDDGQAYELTFYHAEVLYYSLRFIEAAEQYKTVRDSNADNKFLEKSALSVVLSYEKAIQLAEEQGEIARSEVRKSTDRDPEETVVPKPIPELKLKLVEASDRYAAAVPNGEKVPKVLYNAAEVYYTYDHFEEARRRFASLIDGYSQDEVAEYASNLIIESHLSEGNYDEVERFTRDLLARRAAPGQRRDFKGDLVKFKSGAMFKRGDELAASGEYEKAADMYLALLEENPDDEFAANALNNAAVAYEKVERFQSASKLYERLVEQHPDSPLAGGALFRVGLNAERFFDFDKAIASYLALTRTYPTSSQRPDAIYNAAIAFENTQRYEEAAEQYQRYCELFPDRDDAATVCFRTGVAYEKMADPRRVIATYRGFIKKYRGQPEYVDRIIEAQLKIANASEKLGDARQSRRAYRSALEFYREVNSVEARPFAAEAQFQLVELEFDRFKNIKIVGNTRQQTRAIERKAKMLNDIESQYGQILQFKQVDWTMASLYRVGNLYQNFAEAIIEAPCPREVRRQARGSDLSQEELCDEYRVLLEERSFALEDKAVAAYETTMAKARELEVKNDWTQKTLTALSSLRRSQWPQQKDTLDYLYRDPTTAPPLVGSDGAGVFPGEAMIDPAPENAGSIRADQPGSDKSATGSL